MCILLTQCILNSLNELQYVDPYRSDLKLKLSYIKF